MSDQALAWKAGFGALVLVFCAGTWVVRPSHESRPPVAGTPVHASTAPLAPDPSPAPVEAPDDAPPPPRVEVFLHEREASPPAPELRAPRMRQAARHRATPAQARIHPVVAKRKTSPYLIGRKHYPYDPKERWAQRDPQA